MPWYNPRYARPEQPRPSVEQGSTLALFERDRGAERLRVSLESFHGFPFLRFQLWGVNDRGEWWPLKGRCITVKAREVGDLIAALRQVEDLLDRREPPGRRYAAPTPQRPPSAGGRPCGPVEPPGAAPDAAGPDDWPRYVERRRRPTPRPHDPSDLPDVGPAARDFDELG